MSKLGPADYENVLDLIDAVGRATVTKCVNLTTKGTSRCGASVANILAKYRVLYPASTLTDDEIISLLQRGARTGVFGLFCSNATSDAVSVCDPNRVGVPLYFVNQQMVRVNPANKVYAAAFNGPAPVATVDVCSQNIAGVYANAGAVWGNSFNTSNLQSNANTSC